MAGRDSILVVDDPLEPYRATLEHNAPMLRAGRRPTWAVTASGRPEK
ncbi:hypothetical protein [Streptomyces acidicola]|nr:hypothetical protein [Streptomyces acidicola]